MVDLVREIGDHPDEAQATELASKVRDAHAALRQSQLYADNPDTLLTEARLHSALDREDKAVAALERAWKAAPRGSAVALRLARAYTGRGKPDLALKVLREALDRDPDDKTVHLELARMALEAGEPLARAMHHLDRSYARGDADFDARHLHAQLLFMNGSAAEAVKLFREVDHAAPPTFPGWRFHPGDAGVPPARPIPWADRAQGGHLRPGVHRQLPGPSTCAAEALGRGPVAHVGERERHRLQRRVRTSGAGRPGCEACGPALTQGVAECFRKVMRPFEVDTGRLGLPLAPIRSGLNRL